MPGEGVMQGVERAAVLLMALGEDYAVEILKHMDPTDLHRLGAAMANLANVNREQVSEVLHTFNAQVEDQTSMGVDNRHYLRGVLVRALGRDKAKAVMERVLKTESASGIDALKWMDAKAIANGLGSEHPQVVALVLSSLETEQAAAVVGLLPEALRNDAMLRVATLEDIPSGALIELNEIIEKQVMSSISAAATSEVGGPKRAAEILALLDGGIESAILDKVKEVDSELGEEIENLMIAFESLVQVDDRGIQALLREVTSETLMIALRGADEIVRAKILRNMSKRASEMLRDDLEAMPPVRLSDVEKAQREILSTAKRLADAGELSLGGKGGDGFV